MADNADGTGFESIASETVIVGTLQDPAVQELIIQAPHRVLPICIPAPKHVEPAAKNGGERVNGRERSVWRSVAIVGDRILGVPAIKTSMPPVPTTFNASRLRLTDPAAHGLFPELVGSDMPVSKTTGLAIPWLGLDAGRGAHLVGRLEPTTTGGLALSSHASICGTGLRQITAGNKERAFPF